MWRLCQWPTCKRIIFAESFDFVDLNKRFGVAQVRRVILSVELQMGLISFHQLCHIFVSQNFSFLSDQSPIIGNACHQFRKFAKILLIFFSVSLNFCSDFEHKILKLKFRRDFEAEVWSVFCCWDLVEVTTLNLGQFSEARFGQDFNLRFSRDADAWLRF